MSSINQKSQWNTGATLAEKKQKEEAKHRHPKPPACTKLLHAMLHWETRRTPMPPDVSSKPAWEMQTNRWANKWHVVLPQPSLRSSSIAPWTDWPPPSHCKKKKKNTWIIYKELKRTHSRDGGVLLNAPEKGGGARRWTPCELLVNKACKSRRLTVGVRCTAAWNKADSSSQSCLLTQSPGDYNRVTA
jgi:hypothetical protein